MFAYNKNYFYCMELKCNSHYDNVVIRNGTISVCKIYDRFHYFILVQDKHHTVAFSYVPQSTYTYLDNTYKNSIYIKFIDDDTNYDALFGYIPVVFSKSHVVDTWKLTDKYTTLFSKKVARWKFKQHPEFHTYNIFSVIPFLGVTDCIGYSMHHYNNS